MKILKILGILLVLAIIAIVAAGVIMNKKEPQGKVSEDAERTAQKIQEAVNISACEATKFIKWTFGGKNQYVWNKTDDLVSISWGTFKVLINTKAQNFVAYSNGIKIVDINEAAALKEKAWSKWCNDSFWFNPLAKLNDPWHYEVNGHSG